MKLSSGQRGLLFMGSTVVGILLILAIWFGSIDIGLSLFLTAVVVTGWFGAGVLAIGPDDDRDDPVDVVVRDPRTVERARDRDAG